MTSNKDDLEEALQENLRLRRELGAEASRAEATVNKTQGGGVVYRLGRVLYWTGCIIASLSAALGLLSFFVNPDIIDPQAWMFFWPLAIVVWLIGRAMQYILSGE